MQGAQHHAGAADFEQVAASLRIYALVVFFHVSSVSFF
jgi:hypothetical protein